MNKIIKSFFYGNIYLGFYAVALCIETNVLTRTSLLIFHFYLLIFFCTYVYYTTVYVRCISAGNTDERTFWYRNNLTVIKRSLKAAAAIIIIFIFFLLKNNTAFSLFSAEQYLLFISFPLVAVWYTFSPAFFSVKKLRQTGWIKPFAVGFTWAGCVTVYPVFMSGLQKVQPAVTSASNYFLLWLQNFLFFTIIAIIFDIKDFKTDSHHKLKTFAVVLGIRKTFNFIIIPLTILSVAALFLFQMQQHFSAVQIAIQLIPYLLLLHIIFQHCESKSILYYLVAVDGLVFVKALCGIISIIFFK